ncbi:MAG: hypothetical protein Q7J85_07145 [Bacillota bacterium]|nr:hypothetical protein [Bacillota bacterium]
MATANTFTDAAYRLCGMLSPTTNENEYGLEALNNMLSLWGADFLVPVVTRESKALTIGTSEYTIGAGGDLDTVRPMRIENAYLKDSDGYSYPLKEMSADEYNDITLKTQEGRPTKYYFIPDETLSKIIFNFEPDAAYTLYFESWKNFTEFAALTTTVTLPNEYKEAIISNLAIILGEENSIDLPKSVYARADASLSLISRLVAITRIPPKAKFEFTGGQRYNITTDE